MNLAVPGSCNLHRCEFIDANYSVPEAPDLDVSIFEDAAYTANTWGWPHVTELPFEITWDWVHTTLWAIDTASTAVEKAAFTFLEIAPRGVIDPGSIMLLAQALEGIFVVETQGVSRLLRERIEALFGAPATHKKWATQFYALRSRIAHGSASMLRPGEYEFQSEAFTRLYEENFDLTGRTAAVLLATLQDMITHRVSAYRFTQSLERVP